MKRSPIRAKPAAPRRTTGRDGHGPGMDTARAEVMARARGRCEVAGPGCTGAATDAHHRQTRRYGPDCPCNLLALCSHCHHVNVHGQPEAARDLGWIVSRHATDPGARCVQVVRLGLVLLTCEGTYRALDGRELPGN